MKPLFDADVELSPLWRTILVELLGHIACLAVLVLGGSWPMAINGLIAKWRNGSNAR